MGTVTLQQMQQVITKTKSNLDGLRQELDKAERAVMDDPNNGDMAMKAAQLTLQVKAAEKAVKAATEAITAEQERLTSPEAQAEIKELEKINKEGLRLTAEITKACETLHDQMGKWEALQKDAKRFANRYDKQRTLPSLSRITKT